MYGWIPDFGKDVVVIEIGEDNWEKKKWERFFEEVKEVVENKYVS